MEAEDIIVNKSYLELTENEKSLVSEWVKNEDEFNVMKEFLSQTKQLAETQKIQASSSVRENVFSYLHESPIKKNNFFQRFLLFLFPVEKPFYRYPSFQFACMFVLFFGVFKLIDSPMNPDNNLAVHTEEKKSAEESELIIVEDNLDKIVLDSTQNTTFKEMAANKEDSDEMPKSKITNSPLLESKEKNGRIEPNTSTDIGYFDDLSDEVTTAKKDSEIEKKYEEVVYEEIQPTFNNAEDENYKSINQTIVLHSENEKKSSTKNKDRNNQKTSTTAYEEVNESTNATSGTSQPNSSNLGGGVVSSDVVDINTKTIQSIPLSKTNELNGLFFTVND